MTVHGQRSDLDTPVKIKLATHQNGYNITQVVYPNNNSTMNDSWNGFIFHVSPLSNGDMPVPEQSEESPRIDSSVKFSIGHDGEESYYAHLYNSDNESEYVTLDNNYFYNNINSNQPPSRHLSMIDFKRNQLNQSTRSEKSKPVNLHLNLDKNRNFNSLKEKHWSKRSLKKIVENVGSKVLTLTPRGTGGQNSKTLETMGRERKRSRSVGDIEQFQQEFDEEDSKCYSDDDDGDEFGFLSYPFASSSLSLAMNNSKSPTPRHRILPKVRSKTKPLPGVASCMWSPQGNCTWCSVSGRKVVLGPSHLLQLTEAERNALQKIALSKLQAMNLGCHVTIPKESTEGHHRKLKRAQHAYKKRSHSANLGALILDKITDNKDKDKEKESKESHHRGSVFGIPLTKCIANDLEMQKRKSTASLRPEGDDSAIPTPRTPRKSSSSSHSSCDNLAPNGNSCLSPDDIYRRAASSDSLSESDCSRNTNSSFLDTSSLSRQSSIQTENSPLYASGVPQVPQIVNACFRHIETYGLRVLGIFRVGSSKKRVKQLRDEFDSGKDVKLDESHNPHDVGALLKEYFRDLPEPLLTRDLYSPLVITRRLADREMQITALQHLLSLLPVPNRDTLWALLRFLSIVVEHSTDALDADGNLLPGNKMDSHNLATLFGPNIFHKAKYTEKEFSVESVERAEERKEVIDVVKDMIDNYQTLYQVPPRLHDEVFRLLMETNPETTDELLKKKANDIGMEPDHDTTSSSIFDDDNTSLPHSPCSEKDLQNNSQRLNAPSRTSHSVGLMTPNSRRKYLFLHGDSDNSENNQGDKEKSRFRLRFDRSPSPKPPRTPKVKISKDSSSPEPVMRRPRSGYVERPLSENITNSLAIPKPNYTRQNSCSSFGSHLNASPTNSPSGSETSEQWTLPTPPASGSSSPKSTRKVTSSSQRPLGVRESRLNSSAPPGGYPEWERERERWRQWEILAAENNDDSYEKETLV